MNDIEKAHHLFKLQQVFIMSDDTLQSFIQQIENNNIRNNINRFFRGYAVEDIFKKLFSHMPWVKLINELEQEQFPEKSKEDFQVPDFLVTYETSQLKNSMILVEVKSVSGNKTTLNIPKPQFNISQNYTKVMDKPYVYAIFWEKYNYWTLNGIEHFVKKSSEYKIDLGTAIQNDLSIILGDFTYITPSHIYRKSIFQKDLSEGAVKHEKYGYMIKDAISAERDSYIKLKISESVLIDSFLDFKEIEVLKSDNPNQIKLIEGTEGQIHTKKLSNLILNYLEKLNMYNKDKLMIDKMDYSISNEDMFNLSLNVIFSIRKKLDFTKSYQIPKKKTNLSDKLYKEAFETTSIYDKYLQS